MAPPDPRSLRILWVATKSPWPPVDGGRLLSALTLEALLARGHEITVVAPAGGGPGRTRPAPGPESENLQLALVPARPRPLLVALIRAALTGLPVTMARHALAPVRQRVEELLAANPFDLVHVEQLQALSQVEGMLEGGPPIVLRAQNVESDLWAGAAEVAGWRAPLLRREAARLARWEGEAVRRVVVAAALTRQDAVRLQELSGRTVHRVRAPFPASLPAGEGSLPGSPPVVLLAGGSWVPNRDGLRWFLQEIWPGVRRELPEAVLHVFGGGRRPRGASAVAWHPAPAESRQAFVPGSLFVVPLRIASGLRMKILEAWARGLPVVATPEAAAGLEVEEGEGLLLASDPKGFAGALRRLHQEPARGAQMVAGGRRLLAARHDPERVTGELVALYWGALGEKQET